MATSASSSQSQGTRQPELNEIEDEAARLKGRLEDLEGRLRRFKRDLIGHAEPEPPQQEEDRQAPQSFVAAMQQNLSDCHYVTAEIETNINALEQALQTQ